MEKKINQTRPVTPILVVIMVLTVFLTFSQTKIHVEANVRTLVSEPVGDDMEVDLDGSIYLSDYGGKHIRRVTPAGEVQILVSNYPKIGAIAIDEKFIYAASWDYGILLRFNKDGTFVDTLARNLKGPSAIVLNKAGEIFVAENAAHRISRIDYDGKVTTLVQGKPLVWPTSLTIDATGNLYTTNMFHGEVFRISETAEVTHMATLPAVADGRYNLAYTCFLNNDLYVAHMDKHQIFKIAPNGTVTVLAGTGAAGEKDGGLQKAEFDTPQGLACSPDGSKMYVTDGKEGNMRLRVINF